MLSVKSEMPYYFKDYFSFKNILFHPNFYFFSSRANKFLLFYFSKNYLSMHEISVLSFFHLKRIMKFTTNYSGKKKYFITMKLLSFLPLMSDRIFFPPLITNRQRTIYTFSKLFCNQIAEKFNTIVEFRHLIDAFYSLPLVEILIISHLYKKNIYKPKYLTVTNRENKIDFLSTLC